MARPDAGQIVNRIYYCTYYRIVSCENHESGVEVRYCFPKYIDRLATLVVFCGKMQSCQINAEVFTEKG